MTDKRWLGGLLLVAGLALGLSCSAAKSAYKDGQNQAKQGNWDAAVVHYTRAAREDPDNIEYRMALERSLIEAAKFHVQEARKYVAAEDLEKAIEEFTLAAQLDPSNQYAQAQLLETRQALTEREAIREEASGFQQRREQARLLLTTQPVLEPSSAAPLNLRFAQDTSLQRIFEVLSTLSGINVLFDEAFRDRRVTINLVDVSFQEALDKLVLINRLFYKVVDPSTIIIIPDNAQKHRQYDELVLRTFFVTNAEVNTVANMLRTIAGIQRVQPNPELLSITVRATPDQVAVAERIVELNIRLRQLNADQQAVVAATTAAPGVRPAIAPRRGAQPTGASTARAGPCRAPRWRARAETPAAAGDTGRPVAAAPVSG